MSLAVAYYILCVYCLGLECQKVMEKISWEMCCGCKFQEMFPRVWDTSCIYFFIPWNPILIPNEQKLSKRRIRVRFHLTGAKLVFHFHLEQGNRCQAKFIYSVWNCGGTKKISGPHTNIAHFKNQPVALRLKNCNPKDDRSLARRSFFCASSRTS